MRMTFTASKLATANAKGKRPRGVNTFELVAINRGMVARSTKSVALMGTPNPTMLVLLTVMPIGAGVEASAAARIAQFNDAKEIEN